MRLPQFPLLGKVRVCDACVHEIGETQQIDFEEDLAVNSDIISQLRAALNQSHLQSEALKRILVQLAAEASGDSSILDQYQRDPQSEEFSFSVLRMKLEAHWKGLRDRWEEQRCERTELEERQSTWLRLQDEATGEEQLLSSRRAVLDKEMGVMASAEARRDELVRLEVDLQQAVINARQRVRKMELDQAEDNQTRQSGRLNSWGPARQARRSSTSSSAGPPAAFTITTGRQDPLLGDGGRDRCFSARIDGCRRSACALM